MSLVFAMQSPKTPTSRPSALQARLQLEAEEGYLQTTSAQVEEAVHIHDTASVASSGMSVASSIGSQSSMSSDTTKWTSRGHSHSHSQSTDSSRRSSSNPTIDGEKQKRKRSSRSLHIGFDNCSIDLECENKEHPGSLVLKDWHDLFKDHAEKDSIIQCLLAYEMDKPTKLQGHAIAAIVRGSQARGQKSGKSCIMIQGPRGIGKTSAAALAVNAIVDPNIHHIQALILSGSNLRDFDKFYTVFTALQRSKNNYVPRFLSAISKKMTPYSRHMDIRYQHRW